MKQLWNLKDDVQQVVDKWIDDLQLEGTVCGFHIRRGDKVAGGMAEATFQEIDKYFTIAKHSGLQCETCFFSSDNMTGVMVDVNRKINDYFPECKIRNIDFEPLTKIGYDWWAFRHR